MYLETTFAAFLGIVLSCPPRNRRALSNILTPWIRPFEADELLMHRLPSGLKTLVMTRVLKRQRRPHLVRACHDHLGMCGDAPEPNRCHQKPDE